MVARGTFVVRLLRRPKVEPGVFSVGPYCGLVVALCVEEIAEDARTKVPRDVDEAIKQIADTIELL
jgi:hypothetical protein